MSGIVRHIGTGLIAAALLLGGLANADSPRVAIDDAGLALRGYDTVAYFSDGQPQPGNPAFSHEWMGATWLFTSAEHRDAFAADPERYAPQFGGYCAFAVAKGNPAKADPRIWAIVGDRLYLNLAAGVQEKWQADHTALIASARNNWPEVLKGPGKAKATPPTR